MGWSAGDNDDNTVVPDRSRSVFVRQKFSITDISDVGEIILHMDYDDGFAAYINGKEIARANRRIKNKPKTKKNNK